MWSMSQPNRDVKSAENDELLYTLTATLLVQQLQGKAAERNPDEFYFAMQNSSTKDGVHIAR